MTNDLWSLVVKGSKKGKSSAAPDDLFKVNKDSKKLSPGMETTFYNITMMKTVYLVKQARPDALVAITFLTTRVRAPDR